MSNVSISSLIDRSDSMVYFDYLEPAKTDASTFITIMKSDDQVSVVSFSTESKIIYPLSTIQSSHKQINDALDQIRTIKGGALTNMEQAISQGHGMLSNAVNSNRAMILLSDGMWTAGENPLNSLPTDIPIHTIALGDKGQCSFLQEVSRRTNGKYHFSPDAFELAEIYNQIADDSNVAVTAVNQKQQIDSYRFTTIPLQVPAGSDHVSLGVNWLDESITYTEGTPGDKQVNVLLRDPDGKKIDMKPTFLGKGFVTFHLHDPKPGQWTTGCWCGNIPQNIFRGTVGAFEPNSNITFDCKVNGNDIRCGDYLNIESNLKTGDDEISDVIIRTYVESPVYSRDYILEKYKSELRNINPNEELLSKGAGEIDAKLSTLHKSLLPHVNILARRQIPIFSKHSRDKIIHEPIKVNAQGNHTIRIDIEGRIAKNNSKFTRTKRLSVNI